MTSKSVHHLKLYPLAFLVVFGFVHKDENGANLQAFAEDGKIVFMVMAQASKYREMHIYGVHAW